MKQILFILLATPTFLLGQISFNFDTAGQAANIVKVYVISGQSNTGRPLTTAMTAGQLTDYGGARANTWVLNPFVSTTVIQQLNVGTNCYTEAADIRQFGPEASLFKLLQDYKPAQRYLVKFGIGGTSMEGVWKPGRNSFNLLTRYIDTMFSIIVSEGKTPQLAGVIWQQGEADATNLTNANLYQINLQRFNDSLRQRVYNMYVRRGLPSYEFRFCVGKVKAIGSYTYATTVRAAQAAICLSRNAFYVDTDAYPLLDDEHFSATGQITFGTDLYNLLKDY